MADCCGGCGNTMVPRSSGGSRVDTHEGRGLCPPCYRQAHHTGRLDEYPRRNWSRDELMTEWDLLRSDGYTRAQAADRLGIAGTTLDRALRRAKAAGDPRAVLGVAGGVYARPQPAEWTAADEMGDAHALAH